MVYFGSDINYWRLQRERISSSGDLRYIDLPSYPARIRRLLPMLISDLENKDQIFQENFPHLASMQTATSYTETSVMYEHDQYDTVHFDSLYLGRLDTQSGIWSWAWMSEDQKLLIAGDIVSLRDYGFRNDIEMLTKSRFLVNAEELKELLAICVKLKSAIGVDCYKEENIDHFRLLFDK